MLRCIKWLIYPFAPPVPLLWDDHTSCNPVDVLIEIRCKVFGFYIPGCRHLFDIIDTSVSFAFGVDVLFMFHIKTLLQKFSLSHNLKQLSVIHFFDLLFSQVCDDCNSLDGQILICHALFRVL